MKKIIFLLLIVSGLTGCAFANQVQYFWDLSKAVTGQGHNVMTFDKNTSTGGGFFRWVKGSNVGVTNIAGLRIKPTTTTIGWWERVYNGPIDPAFFGTQNVASPSTLQTLGISQGTADTRYGTGVVDVTVDTYDRAAIQFAYNLLGTWPYSSILFSCNTYYVNRANFLPETSTGTPGNFGTYQVNWNGSVFKTTNNNVFSMVSRVVASFADGNLAINYGTYNFSNGSFIGTGDFATGIEFDAGYNCHFDNLRFNNLRNGLVLRWCLNTQISWPRCDVYRKGIALEYLTVSGGSNSNSNCHNSFIDHPHLEATHGCDYGLYLLANDGLIVESPIFEQSESGGTYFNYGCYFNYNGNNNVGQFRINNVHLEGYCDTAAVYIRAANGRYILDGMTCDHDQGIAVMWGDGAGVNPDFEVRNVGFMYPPPLNKFHSTNGNNSWTFYKLKSYTRTVPIPIQMSDDTYWVSGTAPSATYLQEIDCIIN